MFCAPAWAAPPLTETEQRWLAAGQPVLAYARKAGLPVDIIVQPTVHPDISPLSMAYLNGRCKLVLTMRGNPQVEQHLASMPAELHNVLIETMTAHELGHCWRHTRGAWRVLPAGFASSAGAAATQENQDDARLARDMADQRREEGFADLVGLAWTQSRHPALYVQVHAWLARERGTAGVPGSSHDTAAWVRLAVDAAVFDTKGTLFDQAQAPWEAGLLVDD